MSRFDENALREKLGTLTEKLPSIQGVSAWLLMHRRRAAVCVDVWEKELRGASEGKKLPLLYLANDVMQTSRKRGSEFTDAFRPKLLDSLVHLVKTVRDGVAVGKVQRVLHVWKERGVYDRRFVEDLEVAVRKAIPQDVKVVARSPTSSRRPRTGKEGDSSAAPANASSNDALPRREVQVAVNSPRAPPGAPSVSSGQGLGSAGSAPLSGPAANVSRLLSVLQDVEIESALILSDGELSKEDKATVQREIELRAQLVDALAEMSEEHEEKLANAQARLSSGASAETATPLPAKAPQNLYSPTPPSSIGTTAERAPTAADPRPAKRARVEDNPFE
jgi:hypothetical protein